MSHVSYRCLIPQYKPTLLIFPFTIHLDFRKVWPYRRTRSYHFPDSGNAKRGIAAGKSYSKIAQDLFISKETVRTHIKNIYRKLEVTSKADAVRIANENNWVNTDRFHSSPIVPPKR